MQEWPEIYLSGHFIYGPDKAIRWINPNCCGFFSISTTSYFKYYGALHLRQNYYIGYKYFGRAAPRALTN